MFDVRRLLVVVASLILTASMRLSAQSILTVAGGGTDDGRPATVAGLHQPSRMALDINGNLYVSDNSSHRVRKIAAASGIITTVAGKGSVGFSGDGGPATAAELFNPEGVALDQAGNLYIADSSNNRIRKVAAGTGIITTVAGNGRDEFSGDGGPATEAAIYSPSGVAVDQAGNLYIADFQNGRIREVATGSGTITTIAGRGSVGFSGDGGPATAAEIIPYGVALDFARNVYVVDSPNNRIRKIAVGSGIITTVAGSGPTGANAGGFSGDGGSATAAKLSFPEGVALDPAGNLYIADTDNGRIRKVAAGSGIITTVAGNGQGDFGGDGGAATAASLSIPYGVVVDLTGNFYVADTGNSRIRKVSADSGIITTVAGNGPRDFSGDGGPATTAGLSLPYGLTVDSAGNLYIADFGNERVRRVAAGSGIITTVAGNGADGFGGDGGPATLATLANPVDVALDTQGNLYIAEFNNNRIRKVAASSGIITTVAGSGSFGFSGDGGPATAAGFDAPLGVALDSAGNLYITDSGNERIRKVSAATGIITTIAGNGSYGFSGDGGAATAAQLAHPGSVALDPAGNLYVADSFNHRVRKVDAESGIISTVAGNGSDGFSGDGGAATSAELFAESVALDAAGNLFIADTFNNRVRKVAAGSGIITTIAGNGSFAFSGDGGAATAAGLDFPERVALDAAGNLYISDQGSNRVRAVFACVTVPRPDLSVPSDGEHGVSTSAKLAWSRVKGAFSYDVYLDTSNPPQKILVSDVAAPAYNPSNLEPLTTYYWKVVAKGDRFCVPSSSAASRVFSFTTQGDCVPPGAFTGN